jgi:tRNA(fMet)-specific endonuclease VapC
MVSAIAAFELWYGAAKSARPVENANVLDGFFLGPIGILPFESEDSRVAGELRASLERIGKPIGAYDVLIAAQAIRHNLILVTANVKEFGRLKGLKFEDWTKE